MSQTPCPTDPVKKNFQRGFLGGIAYFSARRLGQFFPSEDQGILNIFQRGSSVNFSPSEDPILDWITTEGDWVFATEEDVILKLGTYFHRGCFNIKDNEPWYS